LILPIESLGTLLASFAQSTPIVYLVALLSIKRYSKLEIKRTLILKSLIFYFLFTLVLTSIFFVFELLSKNDKVINGRLVSAPRQIVSFLLGIFLFVVLRNIFKRVSIKKIVSINLHSVIFIAAWILVFDIPAILENSEYRTKSYFSEPSLLADYLVVFYFASLYIYIKNQWVYISLKSHILLFSLVIVSLLLAGSGTGFIKLITLIVGIFIFDDNTKFRVYVIALLLLLTLVGTVYFLSLDNSYLINVLVASKENPESTASFVDRYYSFVGPISKIGESLVSIGYGFGGDNIYYKEFYPNEYIELVQTTKSQDFSIVSFWGKILVFSGITGLVIWFFLFMKIYKLSKKSKIVQYILPILFCIVINDFLSGGAFLLVHHWYWLALIDSQEEAVYKLQLQEIKQS
jgi:hypothetical protein